MTVFHNLCRDYHEITAEFADCVACNILSAHRTDTMISFSRLFRAQNSKCMCQNCGSSAWLKRWSNFVVVSSGES